MDNNQVTEAIESINEELQGIKEVLAEILEKLSNLSTPGDGFGVGDFDDRDE